MVLIRRHLGPFVLSVLASLAAVALAVGPNIHGPYDPSLAVLTATLVAVIWYTFFSYCALHREPAAVIGFELEKAPSRMIVAHVENRSPFRSVAVRWRVVGRRDGTDLDTGPELGPGEAVLNLLPGEQREMNFPFAPAKGVTGSPYGPAVQLGEPEKAFLQAEIVWQDDLRHTGSLGPHVYTVDVQDLAIQRYQIVEEGKRAWAGAGGKKLFPLKTPQPQRT